MTNNWQQAGKNTGHEENTSPTENTDRSAADTSKKQKAWADQQNASQTYTDEAARNHYPGSGTVPPREGSQTGPQYPGWNQYSGYGNRPHIEYKTDPSPATIIWGVVGVILAFWGVLTAVAMGNLITTDDVVLAITACCIFFGIIIIALGITFAVRQSKNKKVQNQGKNTSGEQPV